MTRIVHCPGCRVLLVEPAAGTPIYQCGQCSTILYAKHALQSHGHAARVVSEAAAAAVADVGEQDTPLYRKRVSGGAAAGHESSSSSLLLEATASDKHNKPLYSPRTSSGGGGSSASEDSNKPQARDRLLHDMRKLARDAFASRKRCNELVVDTDAARRADMAPSSAPQWKDIGMDDKQEDAPPSPPQAPREQPEQEEDFTFYDTSKETDMYDATPPPPAEYKPSSLLSDVTGAATTQQQATIVSNNREGHAVDEPASPDSAAPSPKQAAVVQREVAAPSRAYPRLDSPYVLCQHCERLLEVPRNLPPCKKSVQKLRCGACQKISRFTASAASAASAARTSSSATVSRGRASHDAGTCAATKPEEEPGLRVTTSGLDFALDNSPSRSSAPASFHHRGTIASSSGEGKGYASAPEFLSKAALASSSHGRSDSASSGFPATPCLHELFGYESPSQFVNQVEPPQRAGSDRSSRLSKGGIRGFFKNRMMHSHAVNRVVVNGKLIPEELVKRAERQAGPVHYGSYWYDVRAGFWGVMGGPCLGIIPPGIEEFNHHPMPVHCAGGKTGVLVNGRELHHKDLEKLVRRGLPATPGMSYTIDIDGSVMDLASESEIQGLGRLAPTLENRNAGFGMFPLSRA